jgi:V/A-type H+-transporting ATPase subunit C
MSALSSEQHYSDFYRYPSVGTDDWRYQYETAQVRMLELAMLSRTSLLDMSNSPDFRQAADLLAGTEYALPAGSNDLTDLENVLLGRRAFVQELFSELMIDKRLVYLFRTREDFANLRLVIRRSLTKKPLGNDYTDGGNVPVKQLEQAFAEDIYDQLPTYMQQAAEQAAIAYYQNKEVRQIDYAIDGFQAEYNLTQAQQLKNIFLLGLFRTQIDLANIRTMLRLKFTASQSQYYDERVFLKGGYLESDRIRHALDLGYEALGPLFYVTPYYEVVESGANYAASQKSFLRLEQRCDEHLLGFLKTTTQIVTGPQPIIAYLLAKENEIRTVRLILTAKKNHLDTKLILDRVPQSVN